MNDRPESEIMREIQLALANVRGLRLWRANVGKGWVGDSEQCVRALDGSGRTVTLFGARRFDTGLPKGFPDLFGVMERRANVNGTHVIATLPVFIEVKSGRGRVRPAQLAFITAMQQTGCLAGIARSVEDAKRIISGEKLA